MLGGKPGSRRRIGGLARAGAAAVCSVLTVAGAASLVAPRAVAAPDPGQGTALAFTNRIDPRAGSLSLGITFGRAIAGHQNTQAKAQAQAIDLGAIGTSLASYVCNQNPTLPASEQPQPLLVESGQPGASNGISQSDAGGAYTKYGKATTTPYGEAITTTAPLSIAGVIGIGAGVAKSWSGLVSGQREAGATVDISSVNLAGGIALAGLHWDVIYRTTGDMRQTGSFSIGRASIAGVPLPVVDATKLLGQLNAVLVPLGLQLFPPALQNASGILTMGGLQLSVIPNSTRDNLFAAVLQGIQPIRQPLVDALHQAVCQSEVPVSIADIAVGSISGAGSFNMSIGGVSAGSGTIAANQFNLSLPGFNPNGATPQLGGGSTGGGSSLATTGPIGLGQSPAATAVGNGANGATAQSPSRLAGPALAAKRGTRGGALAVVGLSGLALLAALAEGDRRKMRGAQQRLAMFEE